jgi:hypothetical protein
MQRSNFLKNTDLTAGMVFCNGCGIVLTSDTCLACEVEALRRMEEKNRTLFTTIVTGSRITAPASGSFVWGWENTADPSSLFGQATVSGISIGTVRNIRTTSPVMISG